MPEVATKYPQSLLKELKDIGAKCGTGEQQRILKACPKDQFCALPTGEICVYDLKDITSMTQINLAEWSEATTGIPGMYSPWNLIIIVIVFGLGMLLGMWLKKS